MAISVAILSGARTMWAFSLENQHSLENQRVWGKIDNLHLFSFSGRG
jgi:hypothetical protein